MLIFTLFSCKSNIENMVIVIDLSHFDKFSVSCIPYARQLQNLDVKPKMLKSLEDLLLDHHLYKEMPKLGHQMSDERMCKEGIKESKYKDDNDDDTNHGNINFHNLKMHDHQLKVPLVLHDHGGYLYQ